jgi:hypothetical protein
MGVIAKRTKPKTLPKTKNNPKMRFLPALNGQVPARSKKR